MNDTKHSAAAQEAFEKAYLSWNGFHTKKELAHEWHEGLSGVMFREGLAAAAPEKHQHWDNDRPPTPYKIDDDGNIVAAPAAAPAGEPVAYAVVSQGGSIHKLSIGRESADRKAAAWQKEWPNNGCTVRPLVFGDAAPVPADAPKAALTDEQIINVCRQSSFWIYENVKDIVIVRFARAVLAAAGIGEKP